MRLPLRIGSAAVLLAILALALWVGGVLLYVTIGLALLVGLVEYAGLAGRAGARPPLWVLVPLGAWLLYRFVVPADVPALEWGLGAAVVAGLVLGVAAGEDVVQRWSAAVAGALWLGLCLGYYLALLRWHGGDDHFGLRIVGVALAGAFAGDTAALLTGSLVGRHRFFPRISPRKTVEGALGGMAATVLVWVLGAPWLFGLARTHALLLGVLASVAAQGGDLVESALKRAARVKDSGRLVPGHGGLLDRLDALVLLGPVVYCYLRLVALP